MEGLSNLCSVCETQLGRAGSLACGHHFCSDCFSRFVSGSLEELNRNIRCCICGQQSSLTSENHNERILLRFGRDEEPKFRGPTGLIVDQNKDFVVVDADRKKIFQHDGDGRVKCDFSYVHGASPTGGTATTKEGFIVMPFCEGNQRYGLGFYTKSGSFLTTTYMPCGATIGGVAVNSKNHIFVTDPKNAKVYVIKEAKQKISCAIDVLKTPGDRCKPQPCAVVFDNDDNLILTDIGNHCVRVYDFDNRFLFRFGDHGERPGQFKNPVGIAVDAEDKIIIADRDNHRVQLFDPEGTFVEYIVRYKKGDDVYMAPIDVSSLGAGSVAVLLKGSRGVQAGEVRVYSGTWGQCM